MKTLILILIFSSFAQAGSGIEAKYMRDKYMKKGQCVDSTRMSRILNYEIVKKINDHKYELVGSGQFDELKAILNTTETVFDSEGRPGGLSIEYQGTQKLALENGFSATYDVWKECGESKKAIVPAGYDLNPSMVHH